MTETILRPYQERVVTECIDALNNGENALIKAGTGAGKSITIASIVKRLLTIIPNFRCLILIDREVLVTQLSDTFNKECGVDVGVCCASVSKKAVLDKQITIASRQTMINNLGAMQPVHLTILDEAHLVNLHPSNSQYCQILDTLITYNPKMRLLGCTATPWSLTAGFIYGNKHRADLIPWFEKLTSEVTFEELFEQGHLCKLKGLVANYKKPDLSNVTKVGNEYNLGELSTAMCKYVDTVQEVIEEHLQDHEHILVFGCTIEHCEELKEVIPNSETLHSESSDPQKILSDFESKKFRVLISVNKLSIGFDFPPASALVCARPTMSSALFLQIVGRVLRNFPGKKEAVLIDLTENTMKHCPTLDLDRIAVTIPPLPGGGVAPVKFCEAIDASGNMCYAENHPSVVFCVECGHEFPAKTIPEEYKPDLSAVAFTAIEPEWYGVESMEVSEHTSKKNEKRLLRVAFKVLSGYGSKTTSTWICTASDYSGFAVTKGRQTWEIFTDDDFPEDLDMALWVAQESFRCPSRVKCSITQEGYLNILDYDFEEVKAVVNEGEFLF